MIGFDETYAYSIQLCRIFSEITFVIHLQLHLVYVAWEPPR